MSRPSTSETVELTIDLQTHTSHSPSCGWMSPATLVRRAERIGLDGVAVTDHNTTSGVRPARDAASDDLLVVAAEEVDTTEGQIIGLFLSSEIEPGRPPDVVIDEIHDQGGLVLTPHPFDTMRDRFESIESYASQIDAVEGRNSRCVRESYNRAARSFAAEHGIPTTGGSDAHFPREVGTAYTTVEIPAAEDVTSNRRRRAVRRSIESGAVEAGGKNGSNLFHAGTKLVKLYNRVRRR